MTNKNARLSVLPLLLALATPVLALEEVVVISRVDRTEIGSSPVTSVEELMEQLPGVTSSEALNSALGGTATIRPRGLGTGQTLVLVNGTRTNQPGLNLDAVPSNMIERIEVLPNPQGTLYGNDMSGGAINIVTRPDFKPNDPFGSFVLNDVKNDLADYGLAIESKEECDASDGIPVPWWSFSPDTQYSLPWISEKGDFFAWGDLEDGYDPPAVNLPDPNEVVIPRVRDLYDRLNRQFTYVEFNKLRARIRDYPGISEQDKSDYIFGMFFGTMFSGFGSLSDDAARTGRFDGDAAFDEFIDWSQNRSDADRAEAAQWMESSDFFPYSGVADIPKVPAAGSSTSPPDTSSSAPAPAAPASAPAPVPETLPPFDQYAFPPDYAFDFSRCDDELKDKHGETQKDRMIRHIAEREQARADHSYYNDYLRSRWARTMDESLISDALKRRDNSNERLRREWQQCMQGIATAPEDPASTALRAGTRYGNKWNLNVHAEYAKIGEDGPSGPVPGLAGSLHSFDTGKFLGMPFVPGVEKDPDFNADAGSATEFSNESGILRFNGAITGKYLFPGKPGMGYAEQDDDTKLSLGVGYRFGDVRQKVGKDWNVYVDYDWNLERGGPSIGVKYPYIQPDSAYVESVPEYTPFTAEGGTADFDVLNPYLSGYFNFGGKGFFEFTYPQYGDFDPNSLGAFGTYWANNECGDSALPPEGSGYLTAAESPVKEVSDQWALKHVGIAATDPSLAGFTKPVIVAVIDTGLDWHHLDFSWDNLWRNEDEIPDNGVDDDNNGYVDDVFGWSFTDNNNRPWDYDGHGTFVAGVIAATQGNGAGIDGINADARIMVLKALNNFGRTRATRVAKAIVYAADNGAQLINLSVTGPGFPKIVQDAVDYAREKGALVINAAGNKAEDIDVEHPDALRGVLTVAATGPNDERAVFSNVGNAVTIAAPGIDIVSLRARVTDFMHNSADTSYVKEDAFLGEDRRYYRGTGTSFAAPIVTGVASLLLSRNPELEPADIVRILEQSARDVGAPGRDRLTGYGVVDARAALAADPAFFAHAQIAAVQPVEMDGRQYAEIFGVAEADQFKLARLEIGQGADPSSWTAIGGALTMGVNGGSLGRVPLDSLSGAEAWTIRLVVEHQNGRTREARYVIRL